MTTIGEAVASLGIHPQPDEDWIVCRIHKGDVVNRLLVDVADASVEQSDIYLASGAFVPGSVDRKHGRAQGNLVRVHSLPFDCDLADWLPDKDVTGDVLKTWDQDEIDAMVPYHADDVRAAFADVGVPIHSLLYTGHGLLALVRVAGGTEIDAIRDAHKAIIATINKRAGFHLIDPAASDSGTRVYRLPGTVNAKGVPRTVRMLQSMDGAVSVAQLTAIAGKTAPAVVTAALPMHARKLDAERAQGIVDAVRPHWDSGKRHRLAFGLAAYIGKNGVPEEQALAIMEALTVDDAEAWDRRRAVSDTYARLRGGSVTSGYHVLRDLLPVSVMDYLDRELSTLRHDTGARVILHGTDQSGAANSGSATDYVRKFDVTPLPESVWFGWFAEYRELVQSLTVSPDQFHLAASLTMASSLLGRRVRTKFGLDLYGNLYTVLLGPSGSSKKDTAINWALTLPQLIGPTGQLRAPAYAMSRDVSSSEGIVQMLKNEPNTLLYLTELSTMLANARRKGTSTILEKLIEAWDSPHVLENLNKLNPNRAENPYLSIIAATQPSRFAQQVTEEDIASGFLNRWLFVPGVGKGRLQTPGEIDEARGHELYARLSATMLLYGAGTTLRLTDAAKARVGAWYDVVMDAIGDDDSDEASMRQRHQTIAVKIALVYAASEGATCIDVEHVEPAIALVEWSWENVQVMMGEWAVSRDVAIEQRILAAIKRNGPMTRRQLQRSVGSRKWSAQEFAKTLDAMMKNETVAFTPTLGKIGIPVD